MRLFSGIKEKNPGKILKSGLVGKENLLISLKVVLNQNPSYFLRLLTAGPSVCVCVGLLNVCVVFPV